MALGGNSAATRTCETCSSACRSPGAVAGRLSGLPIDIAFDNQRNLGGLPSTNTNTFAAGLPQPANGKLVYRNGNLNSSEPQFLLASVPNPVGGGVIDVLALGQSGACLFDTDPYAEGVQSIPVPSTILSDYFRHRPGFDHGRGPPRYLRCAPVRRHGGAALFSSATSRALPPRRARSQSRPSMFAGIAGRYDLANWSSRGQALAQAQAACWRDLRGKRVLDVACGTGTPAPSSSGQAAR